MKATATCPKCGSTEIHVIRAQVRYGNAIPIGSFESARTEHHVCTSCGFVECYVVESKMLARIAAKYPSGE
jgi:predicted nucleic-acid-binding Zn-ribbon protein